MSSENITPFLSILVVISHLANGQSLPPDRPLVIAHRGSSGVLPEHTHEAYERGIRDGADYIECDVTLTEDLIPVCIHENNLSPTTNVENRTEFADRKRTMNVTWSTGTLHDWFAIHFNVNELKTLRTNQRFRFRDPKYNGWYNISTLEEYIELAQQYGVGIYPEVKDPEWINPLIAYSGKRFEDIILETLTKHGYNSSSSKCFIQSFSFDSIEYLSNRTQLPLIFLTETALENETLSRLRNLSVYGIGVWIAALSNMYSQGGYKNWITHTTDFVSVCHSYGFKVHVWTLRNEDTYLAWNFQQDVHLAYDHFFQQEVDGFFTDFPLTLSRYLDFLYPVTSTTTGATPATTGATPATTGATPAPTAIATGGILRATNLHFVLVLLITALAAKCGY